MKILQKLQKLLNIEGGLQDFIFLMGILLFISILIIGLLPDESSELILSQDFFIYSIMTIPIVVAIYFIIISFRRNFYQDSASIGSSIRKKILLAFVFISVMPILPLVLVSNYLMNQTVNNLFFDKTSNALYEARTMSSEPISELYEKIDNEIKSLKYIIDSDIVKPNSDKDRAIIRNSYKLKNIRMIFFGIEVDGSIIPADPDTNDEKTVVSGLVEFYKITNVRENFRVNRIALLNNNYFAGHFISGKYLIVLYSIIPEIVNERINLFDASLKDYKQVQYFARYFRSNSSLFLLSLSIFMVIISILISAYLSRNITWPVLELAEAANEIASGNFNIHVFRESQDELGVLYKSFNKMIEDLNYNRKMMYQKQRLEAWKEMARKVVHEIKNPLTPIRLSAERMKKRYLEGSPEINEIILTGTDTIIEEVETLMRLLSEFTNFARLPEIKPVKLSITPILENSVTLFAGHERINFILDLDKEVPEIYFDKVLIKRALGNLIQNAIDAIGDHGTITITSHFISDLKPPVVRIILSDSGGGIKEDDLERIFEPGFSRKASGSGLGLAIVEKIILDHQGRIYCKSELGKGAQFYIELPVVNQEVYIDG